HIHDPEVENTISLLTGYAAYLPAEHLGVSGILAVVATGLYLRRVGPRVVAADTRVQNSGMWDVVVFVLEGLIFIITGLALRPILGSWSGPYARDLMWGAVLVSVTVIVARFVWVFPATYLPRALSARVRLEDLSQESWMHPDALTHTRDRYRYRARHLRGHADGVMDGPLEAKSEAHLRLARELLAAERRELLRLRDEGTIGDAVMRRV